MGFHAVKDIVFDPLKFIVHPVDHSLKCSLKLGLISFNEADDLLLFLFCQSWHEALFFPIAKAFQNVPGSPPCA
jgi:hypothetical protein